MVTFPATLLALQGGMLSCSARGTPPIYTALIRNSAVLLNTTNTTTIRLDKDGNYTCLAINQYGTDKKELQVSFASKSFLLFWPNLSFLVKYGTMLESQSQVNLRKRPVMALSAKCQAPVLQKINGLETISSSTVVCGPYCY